MEVGGDSTPCSRTSKEDKVGVSSLVWPSIATRALLSSEVKVTSAIPVARSMPKGEDELEYTMYNGQSLRKCEEAWEGGSSQSLTKCESYIYCDKSTCYITVRYNTSRQ